MKQTLFATRQRAEELVKEVSSIWQQGYQKENMEGIEQDPVFTLLMTALAYQSNEIDDEIERLKAEVLEEYARMFIPYNLCRPTPAAVVVRTAPQEYLAELEVDSNSPFTLLDTPYRFTPLFKTRVVNGEVKTVTRIDGRRWKVSLLFKNPLKSLAGISFCVANNAFQDLKVTANGHALPLTKPWDYANLPLATHFSLDSMLYNKQATYNAAYTWFDLFAQQNIRIFHIEPYDSSRFPNLVNEQIELVFEFSGLSELFTFDKTQLLLNCLPLVNVEEYTAHLSSTTPIVRVSEAAANEEKNRQFLHLLRPTEEQINHQESVEVRRVAADRFNLSSLIRLTNCIIHKFSSDFYAFQGVNSLQDGTKIYQLYHALKGISDELNKEGERQTPGTYLMLRRPGHLPNEAVSLKVSYLTTNGSALNSVLNAKSSFLAPPGLDSEATQQLVPPLPGIDEVQGFDAQNALAQYALVTNDRLVTPADIKLFCYKELMVRYGIASTMVESIKPGHRQQIDRTHCGYEITVEIILTDNTFIKRNFVEKIPQVEFTLQKMIEVRSTGIYPVLVSIRVRESQKESEK